MKKDIEIFIFQIFPLKKNNFESTTSQGKLTKYIILNCWNTGVWCYRACMTGPLYCNENFGLYCNYVKRNTSYEIHDIKVYLDWTV